MLFDEKDLSVFDNPDSRSYFKEILQSYYSQNYRATIVLLYSFVIYDLFMKLQTMANEGDSKANKKLTDINAMIADDEKYSKVENEIIQFFKDNCPLYFNRFIEDIDYLKICRNKCAHLKVDDNTLYIPSDYHARMLICSMYDHILSVKAPFIMDLFSIAQADVENYTNSISYISDSQFDESIKANIENKYLKRMTYDSLKKSYKTFIRLLFVSEDEKCIENIYGLYAFAYVMTGYILRHGFQAVFKEDSILDTFLRIPVSSLENSSPRKNALIKIIMDYPIIMDIVRENQNIFAYIVDQFFSVPHHLKYYHTFYPRSEKSVYTFFKEAPAIQQSIDSEILYNAVKDSPDFDLGEFSLLMVKKIPNFSGFDSADGFMNFFTAHLQGLTISEINSIMAVYYRNNQCTLRGRHSSDNRFVKKYIETHCIMRTLFQIFKDGTHGTILWIIFCIAYKNSLVALLIFALSVVKHAIGAF